MCLRLFNELTACWPVSSAGRSVGAETAAAAVLRDLHDYWH